MEFTANIENTIYQSKSRSFDSSGFFILP